MNFFENQSTIVKINNSTQETILQYGLHMFWVFIDILQNISTSLL